MIRGPPGSKRTTHSFPTRRSSDLRRQRRHHAQHLDGEDAIEGVLIALAGRGELLAHRVAVALGGDALAAVGEPAEERSHQAVLERYEQLLLAPRLDLVVAAMASRRAHLPSLPGLAEARSCPHRTPPP